MYFIQSEDGTYSIGWLPFFSVFLYYSLVEIAWSVSSARRFPIGPVYFPLAVLVVLAVTWMTHRFSRQTLLPVETLPATMGVVLGGKLYVVTGFRFSWLLLGGLVVLAPLLVLFLWTRLRSNSSRGSWGVLVGLSLLVSTDALKVLWLQIGAQGTIRLTWVLLTCLAMVGGLWLFLESWPFVRRLLDEYTKSNLILMVLAVVAVTGCWFVAVPAASLEDRSSSIELDRVKTTAPPAEQLPNIVLISIDTLRWDMVPPRAEGHDLPHLTSLRKDSVTFNHAFSESSWTLPAHVSLFTGLLPVRHGVQLPRNRIDPSFVLFPQLLQTLGYPTAAMTDGGFLSRKYGYDRGFDVYWQHAEEVPFLQFRGYVPGSLEVVIYLQTRFGSGPDLEWRHEFPTEVGKPRKRFFQPNLKVARRWLDHLITRGKPGFTFLHTYEVHDANLNIGRKVQELEEDHSYLSRTLMSDTRPLQKSSLPEEQWKQFLSNFPDDMSRKDQRVFSQFVRNLESETKNTFKAYLGALSKNQRHNLKIQVGDVTGQQLTAFRKYPQAERKKTIRGIIRSTLRRLARRHIYGYGVESVDESLGKFLKWMKQRGLYRDSLIVFLSDHGEGFRLISEVRGHGEGRLSEVLTRVPVWVKLPGNQSAGASVSHPIQLRHVFPMVLKELGVDLVCKDDGGPLCPSSGLASADPLPLPRQNHVRTSIAYQISSNQGRSDTDKQIKLGVRSGEYKRIHLAPDGFDSFWKVYGGNLLQGARYPDEIPRDHRRRLGKIMEHYEGIQQEAVNPFLRKTRLGQELRKELQGLGYL